MANISQKEAAKRFAKRWEGRGAEQRDDRSFWLQLLMDVFRVDDPFAVIEFQKPVKMESSTRFIDAFMPTTRVLIEQKGVDVDLNKKYRQSGGAELTPFEQALRYDQYMLPDEHPRWIVGCNFRSFQIHNMNRRFDAPEVILLKDLAEEYSKLSFITDARRLHIQREQKVSMEAGEIVGRIYDALRKQYIAPDSEHAKRSLNILCVRFVFCLYAEDAGIFKKDQFHDYLKGMATDDLREGLIKLFKVLDTPYEERDPYLKKSLAEFPYTNGGLFRDQDIEIPMFTDEIKDILVEHASDDFDWSSISPTIFGSLFESTLNPETRRKGGMHYTSVENIHKVIDPLFLDDLKGELQEILDNGRPDIRRRKLYEFQDKLASLKFLDPACGSGNFLTETYLSLRRLENTVLRELTDGNMVLDLDENLIKVSISQFYGIEINDFAADVARTALWISEAQMLDETRNIVQREMDFLPLKSNANIRTGNALRMDWNDVIPAAELNYIMGNPPFIGYSMQTSEQKKDMMDLLLDAKGKPFRLSGKIDYVSGWYYKASQMIAGRPIRVALVSTNSITQGEQVEGLWKDLYDMFDIHIDFAYRTFRWDSGAANMAHVHCVIIGFSSYPNSKPRIIFDGKNAIVARNINCYLIDADDVFIGSNNKPVSKGVEEMINGNKAADGGFLIFDKDVADEIEKTDPVAFKYVKPFIGAREFINGEPRYCLWLKNASPADIRSSSVIKERVAGVQAFREASPKAATIKSAAFPTLFQQIRQPDTDIILIPRVSSEGRKYIPIGFLSPDHIVSDAIQFIPDATLYHFGILTSSVHMAWTRVVCGRLKSDYRYSNDIVYNNFPWPTPTEAQKETIEKTAQGILDARALYLDSSLADLYDDLTMPVELRKAHQANDVAVMGAYGFRKDMSESEIVAELFKMYQKQTSK